MRRPSPFSVRILIALLCAALSFAPGATFAMPASGGDGMHATRDGHEAPCPSSCQDCGDRDMSASCVAACMGLATGIPPVDDAFVQRPSIFCVAIAAPAALRGQHREPDTPPPKMLLA